jgi:hypothetical protein
VEEEGKERKESGKISVEGLRLARVLISQCTQAAFNFALLCSRRFALPPRPYWSAVAWGCRPCKWVDNGGVNGVLVVAHSLPPSFALFSRGTLLSFLPFQAVFSPLSLALHHSISVLPLLLLLLGRFSWRIIVIPPPLPLLPSSSRLSHPTQHR